MLPQLDNLSGITNLNLKVYGNIKDIEKIDISSHLSRIRTDNEKIRNAKTQEEMEQILAENKDDVWRNKADENLIHSAIVETSKKFAKERKDISIAKEQARPQKDPVVGVEVIDVDAENDHEGH